MSDYWLVTIAICYTSVDGDTWDYQTYPITTSPADHLLEKNRIAKERDSRQRYALILAIPVDRKDILEKWKGYHE